MKIIQKIVLAFVACVIGLGLPSCKEDPYVEIIAVNSCSPDLLEFVTPTVTIRNVNGESYSVVLSPSDFKESTKGGEIHINVTGNGNTTSTSSTAVNHIATASKRFEGESASGEIEVNYAIKDNVVLNKENYIFFHGTGYDYKTSGSGLSVISESSYIKPIAYEVSKEDVENYLKELSSMTDKTPFKVSASVAK